MYKIKFYKDKYGNSPILQYIKNLQKKNDKDSRIKAGKINDYIQALCENGTTLGEPFMKKLDDEIWELRPLRDRILFAVWVGNSFLLISHFMKKTKKTPIREIEKAKRLLKEFLERSKRDGENL
ncbi:MAG: type II toxin-antitoxin system RelE/ParE family toxin [Selenomonadaceae bacterium]|nr:type II toxin-antitoxin system RelE/ParE family toxin [Selenomonadaceae bacterium]